MGQHAASHDAPNGWELVAATRRLHRHLERRLDGELEGCAISYAQFELLELLTRDRNAHAAALARRLDVSRQIASRLLGKLARADLVELLPPDGGVRVPIVTDQGRRRLRLAAEATQPVRRRAETLDPDRRAHFVGTAEDLVDALRPPQRPWWLD